MRKNPVLIIFAILFVILISSTVFASQGEFGGDECSGARGKSQFCCSICHSGSNGDCKDLVVNDIDKKCAFVDDLNICKSLPLNWHPANEVEGWGKICPEMEFCEPENFNKTSLGYEWLDKTLDCEAKIISKNNIDNKKDIVDDKQQKSSIIPMIGISTAIIILLIILWFFLIKQRR